MTELSEEDNKLVTLARGARGRISAAEGAAIRDDMGRTYSGATVDRLHLKITALELAVAQAVASGATGIECAVIVGATDVDTSCVVDLGGSGVPVLLCASDGTVQERRVS